MEIIIERIEWKILCGLWKFLYLEISGRVGNRMEIYAPVGRFGACFSILWGRVWEIYFEG